MELKNEHNLHLITFTLVMCSFNYARYIKEAIESILFQTYPHWELIIVDDASKDNSLEVIKPFLSDPRINLIVHKKNKGAGLGMIEAIQKASNMIIGIVDSDDKLHKNALEIFAKEYKENPDVGFVFSTFYVCDKDLNVKHISKFPGPVDSNKTNLLERKTGHFITFRKEIYEKTKGCNGNLKMALDLDLICKLEEITRFKFVNKPLYYYRIHEASASKSRKYEAKLAHYKIKINAFHRRKNTSIPNVSLSALFLEYYNLTFYKIIRFISNLKLAIRTKKIGLMFSRIFPKLYFIFSTKYEKLIKTKILYVFP